MRSLFPSFVHLKGGTFAASSLAEEIDESRDYADETAAMGAVRRAEFLAGRRFARAAIASCAPERGPARVPSGPERTPRWPDGIVGTITHTRTLAAAAVARAHEARGLGLVNEERMATPIARQVRDQVATVAELRIGQNGLSLDEASTLTLIFSAKEAVFKCLFPIVGRYFDYLEAALVEIDDLARVCTLAIETDLGGGIGRGTRLHVRFAIDALLVTTATWLAPAGSSVG